jgi:hypothetical protein
MVTFGSAISRALLTALAAATVGCTPEKTECPECPPPPPPPPVDPEPPVQTSTTSGFDPEPDKIPCRGCEVRITRHDFDGVFESSFFITYKVKNLELHYKLKTGGSGVAQLNSGSHGTGWFNIDLPSGARPEDWSEVYLTCIEANGQSCDSYLIPIK